MTTMPRLVALLAAALLAAAAFAQTKPDTPASTPQKPTSKPAAATVFVLIETSMGDLVFALDAGRAPESVKNFLSYTDKEFYDGTIFHRVMKDFMVQGGGFDQSMQRKSTDPPVVNEWRNGLKNKRGTIAMARTQQPDSATSQFFINVVDNDRLDQPISGGAGYAVFGSVVAGMDVVDEIRIVPTGRQGPYGDVPSTRIVIKKVRRIDDAEAEKRMKGVAPKKNIAR